MDGDLRKLFRAHIPEAMWTSIESPYTQLGIPDLHFIFYRGITGFIENKKLSKKDRHGKIKISPEQVAFALRYSRMGGRHFIAVRRFDVELRLYAGTSAPELQENNLMQVEPLGVWDNGPAKWDWKTIGQILSSRVTY